MSKQIIAIDADDTIFDENSAIIEFHNRIYGTNHTVEDYLKPGTYGTFWEHIWNIDKSETLRRYEEYIEHKLIHNIPPITGALEVLKFLSYKYQLVVVTSRDERGVTITHDALAEHYPKLFQDVHFVSLWGKSNRATKAQICNDIGAEYLIDDSYEHCILAAESGIEALLFGTYGWNHHQALKPHMMRVKDWHEVKEYFDGRS